MPHHNSTPKSILDAPVSTPVVVAKHSGKSRAARRERYGRNWRNAAVTNVPHVGHHGNKARVES